MSSNTISPIPASIGILLWGAATALLLEEAIHAGRYDVATMATPILTAATVAAACLAHMRFARLRLIGGAGFLLLALLGSAVMVSGTLGRLAEAKDGKEAAVQTVNRTYGEKQGALDAAKVSAKAECKVMGPRCKDWQSRVDVLTRELSGLVVRSADPKADAIARLVSLVGGDGEQAKAIVQAFDPVTLPLFLEFGSVLFFGAAFHARKPSRKQGTDNASEGTVEEPAGSWSQAMALRDFQTMRQAGAQQFLSAKWGVAESTVSRWLATWERDGLISRRKEGKCKATLALPAPR
jgi:hypothetical protein